LNWSSSLVVVLLTSYYDVNLNAIRDRGKDKLRNSSDRRHISNDLANAFIAMLIIWVVTSVIWVVWVLRSTILVGLSSHHDVITCMCVTFIHHYHQQQP
jgi:hypothetical protein